MIDFIKIKINGCNSKRLLDNPLLEFNRSVSEKSGLLNTKTVARHHHCTITVYDGGTIIFSGSIHKMYNSLKGIKPPRPYGNGYNGNPFNWQEINFSIKYLVSLFEVETYQMQIQQIEYGQNLVTTFDPQAFISGLLMHQGKAFEFRYNENYSQAVHSDYLLKIYNKGNQYQLPIHTLRVEIKVFKMRYQQKDIGASTIADITPERLKKTFTFLREHLQDIIYFDTTINKKELSKVDKNRLQKLSNPNYWKKLPSNKRHEPKKNLAALNLKKSQNLKGELMAQIMKNEVIFHRLFKTKTGVTFHSSTIRRNITLKSPKKCPITGLSLEFEKDDAKYARTTTLKQLKKVNKYKYFEICSILLSKSKFNRPKFENDLFKHLVKQIRNRYYNPNQVKKLGYNKRKTNSQLALSL